MIGLYIAGTGALLMVFALLLVWDVVLWALMDFRDLSQAEPRVGFRDYVALYCGIIGSCLLTFGLVGQGIYAIWSAL